MKFLIDTNIMIPLDPMPEAHADEGTRDAAEFARLASEAGHQTYLHPVVSYDIDRDRNEERKTLRRALLAKYAILPHAPGLSAKLIDALGRAEHGSNDWVDDNLLAALHADAVDYLVTNDERVHRKARRLGLGGRVARAVEAAAIIKDLSDVPLEPPPAARRLLAHDIDASDPIFDGLRRDYAGFDGWLAKCKREHRRAWAIEDLARSGLAGVCIVKTEHEAFGLTGKMLKLCTFKIMEGCHGNRYGELLLKCVFDHAFGNRFDGLYLTVYPKHEELISLMEAFGFSASDRNPATEEIVLTKRLRWDEDEKAGMDSLSFHVKFGPWTTKLEGAPLFVVPVQPQFHEVLFPDLEQQTSLLAGSFPCGNSIRKAYLSRSRIGCVSPGSNLLFYRSVDRMAATALGIVEQTLSSPNADEIARFAGKRTVYTYSQIREMCTGPVLAILFRRVRFIDPPIALAELVEGGIVRAAPQTITQAGEKGKEWLKARLGM